MGKKNVLQKQMHLNSNRRYRMLVANADAGLMTHALKQCTGSEPMFDPVFHSNPMLVKNNNCYAYAAGALKTSTFLGENHKMQPGDRTDKEIGHILTGECRRLLSRIDADWLSTDMIVGSDSTKCPTGYYRVALVHTTLPNRRRGVNWDYHFYCQVINPFNAEYERITNTTLRNANKQVMTLNKNESVMKRKVKYLNHLKAVLGAAAFRQIVLKYGVLPDGMWAHKRGTAYPPQIEDARHELILDPSRAHRNYGRLNYKTKCNYQLFFKNNSGV